jgi:hypothetical protein
METGTIGRTHNASLVKVILFAGLIVGTLDIIAASVQVMIAGREPVQMLKFIASGIFGRQALSGEVEYAIYGLFFHYGIATIWAALFFLIYPRFPILSKHRIMAGIVYAILVKFCMSEIVLPLSNTPPLPFTIKGSIIATLILIAAIGLPLSFLAYRHYIKNSNFR